MSLKKCGKCGKLGHNARTCGKGDSPSVEAPKKKKAKSWLKSVEAKLSAVAESDDGSPKPSERSGEPFADLPPLDLPPSDPSTTSGSDGSSENKGTAESASDASTTETSATGDKTSETETATEKKVFDTKTLQKMAYGIGVGYMKLTSEIAMKGSHMAIGEDMWPIVGMACSVLVKKNAEKFDIDDETGSLIVIGGLGGFNGVQAGRTLWEEHLAKKKEAQRERATAAGKQEQQRQQNGVTPAVVADLRKQSTEHAGQQRTAGPVV